MQIGSNEKRVLTLLELERLERRDADFFAVNRHDGSFLWGRRQDELPRQLLQEEGDFLTSVGTDDERRLQRAIAFFLGNHHVRARMGEEAAADLECEGWPFHAISVGNRVELEGDRTRAKKRPRHRTEKNNEYPEHDRPRAHARPSRMELGDRGGRERDRANDLSRAFRCARDGLSRGATGVDDDGRVGLLVLDRVETKPEVAASRFDLDTGRPHGNYVTVAEPLRRFHGSAVDSDGSRGGLHEDFVAR